MKSWTYEMTRKITISERRRSVYLLLSGVFSSCCQLDGMLSSSEHLSAVLNPGPIGLQDAILPHLGVLVSLPFSESPLGWNKNLLSSRELELCSPQGFYSWSLLIIFNSHWQNRLTNANSGNSSLRFAECSSHPSLQPISASTTQHFIYPDDVERVHSNSHVESVFATVFNHVLVGTNSSGFQRLAWQLFQLIRDQMHTAWKFINSCPLASDVVDSDLGVRYTSTETRLRIGLIFTIAVATGWAASHLIWNK